MRGAGSQTTTTHAPEAPLRPPPKFRPHPFAYHEEVTVTIDDLSSLGDGVGRVHIGSDASDADGDDRGWVVMVPFTLPSETVRARVFRNHKGHSDADLLEVVGAPSAVRTEPRCALFGVCGGCQYQHVEYAEQLRQLSGELRALREERTQAASVPPTPAHLPLQPIEITDPNPLVQQRLAHVEAEQAALADHVADPIGEAGHVCPMDSSPTAECPSPNENYRPLKHENYTKNQSESIKNGPG